MSEITKRYQQLNTRLVELAIQCHRSVDSIQIIAISKTRSVAEILDAYMAGCHRFGESYIQEAVPKIQALSDKQIEWHFIGPIQANKTQAIANNFAWVHSIDRQKIARRLNDQRATHIPRLNVCIQVNISAEKSKSGVDIDDIVPLAHYLETLPRLKLRGLMAIAQKTSDNQQQRQAFRHLYEAQQELILAGLPLDTLSMGMSGDWEAAVLEGATMIRIGTALFGARNYVSTK